MASFFMEMIPPTATAQEKQVRVVRGKPVFYDPPKVKEAREILTAHLVRHRPDAPLKGAVYLNVVWQFPKGRHKDGAPKTTKPDTDNLQKLLKDCMTRCGYWVDDAQVAVESVIKQWSSEPCGIYVNVGEIREREADDTTAD